MVSMRSSLSDQAWGRDSAVYRVSGVLAVVGGWFFTAMMAFTVSSILATAIYFGGAPVVIILLVLAGLLITRTRLFHRLRVHLGGFRNDLFRLRIDDRERLLGADPLAADQHGE